MSNYFLVEGKVRADMRWVKTERTREIKRVLKGSELNKKNMLEYQMIVDK